MAPRSPLISVWAPGLVASSASGRFRPPRRNVEVCRGFGSAARGLVSGRGCESIALEREQARKDFAHDLVAAAADRTEAGGASRALDPVLAHVAGAAVDLKAVVHQLERGALRQELGHRHLADRLLARDEAAQSVVGYAAAGVGRGGEVDELVAYRLVAGERAAERVTLSREGGGAFPRALQRADGAEGHREALPLEVGHDQGEALVQAAEQVLLRDEDVLEADRGRVRGVPAELLEL